MKPYGTNEQSEDRCVVVALRSNACRTFLTKSRLSALNYFNMYPESSEVEESLEKYFAPRKILDGNTRQLEKGCVTLQHFITHELSEDLASTSSSAELCSFFPAILARIFGRQDGNAAGESIEDTRDSRMGSLPQRSSRNENSWMFVATTFYALGQHLNNQSPHGAVKSSGPSPSHSRGAVRESDLCCMSFAGKKLLSLLLAKPVGRLANQRNLFEVLRESREVWYKFSCFNPPLPPQTLAALLHDPLIHSVVFENSKLYRRCLQKPPRVFVMDDMDLGRHGHYGDSPRGEGGGGPDGASSTPSLELTMLEYYLFCFAWYATSSASDFYGGKSEEAGKVPLRHCHSSNDGYSSTSGGEAPFYRPERMVLAWRRFGVLGLTHCNPYMVLLKNYLGAFCPHDSDFGQFSYSGESTESELFLRILAEFWLEGNAVRRPGTHIEASSYARSPYGVQQHYEGVAWDNSFETWHVPIDFDPISAEIVTEYVAPTDVSIHGLLLVSAHLLADPCLKQFCSEALTLATTGGSDRSTLMGRVRTALTHPLATLRPHVFSFLRTTFSKGSAVEPGSTAFALAVELWLLWLRPWAAPSILKGYSPLPQPRQARGNAMHTAGSGRGSRGAGGNAERGRGNAGGLSVAGVFSFFVGNGRSPTNLRGNVMNSNSGSHQPPVSLSRAGGGSIASAGDYTWGWSAWVLENYSLYISILAAFTKKVINMPFKVPFAIDSQNAGSHNRDGTGLQWLSDMGTGRASVELLWRVTSVFDEELVRLLARCQETIAQGHIAFRPRLQEPQQLLAEEMPTHRHQSRSHAGCSADNDGVNETSTKLGAWEELFLENGRQAVSSIQGNRLVVLSTYTSSAQDLLTAMAELIHPPRPRGWWREGFHSTARSEMDETTGKARAVSVKIRKLFKISPNWKIKEFGDEEARMKASRKVKTMFKPDRDKTAPSFLSKEGRKQLVSGQKACRPWDVTYIGDPMHQPVRSWEREWSVRFFINVSEWLNESPLRLSSFPRDLVETPGENQPMFPDEGPSRAILDGKAFQKRQSRERWHALVPQRYNLRPLADLRAMLGLLVGITVCLAAWRFSSTSGAYVTACLAALCIRLSFM